MALSLTDIIAGQYDNPLGKLKSDSAYRSYMQSQGLGSQLTGGRAWSPEEQTYAGKQMLATNKYAYGKDIENLIGQYGESTVKRANALQSLLGLNLMNPDHYSPTNPFGNVKGLSTISKGLSVGGFKGTGLEHILSQMTEGANRDYQSGVSSGWDKESGAVGSMMQRYGTKANLLNKVMQGDYSVLDTFDPYSLRTGDQDYVKQYIQSQQQSTPIQSSTNTVQSSMRSPSVRKSTRSRYGYNPYGSLYRRY